MYVSWHLRMLFGSTKLLLLWKFTKQHWAKRFREFVDDNLLSRWRATVWRAYAINFFDGIASSKTRWGKYIKVTNLSDVFAIIFHFCADDKFMCSSGHLQRFVDWYKKSLLLSELIYGCSCPGLKTLFLPYLHIKTFTANVCLLKLFHRKWLLPRVKFIQIWSSCRIRFEISMFLNIHIPCYWASQRLYLGVLNETWLAFGVAT